MASRYGVSRMLALLAKVLADALFLGEGISHRSCSCADAARGRINGVNRHAETSFVNAAGAPFMGATPRFFYARSSGAKRINYLISTFAPASSSFFFMASESALLTPSLTSRARLRPGPSLPSGPGP